MKRAVFFCAFCVFCVVVAGGAFAGVERADSSLGSSLGFSLGFSGGARPVVAEAANGGSLSARGCAACHADVYADWRGTRHALAFANGVFLDGLRREPQARCVHCHAPLAAQRRELGPVERASSLSPSPTSLLFEGVTCAACHVRDGRVLVAAAVVPRDDTPLHETAVTPALKDPAFCASCHQFSFAAGDTLMQGTYDEWRRYRDAGGDETCQSCHMPGGRHTFRGAWDLALLRDALVVAVVDGERALRLSSKGVGHSFPTGDLFRHLTVEASVDGAFVDVFFVGRRFAEAGKAKKLVSDTSLVPGVTTTVPLPASATAWRVRYHYAERRHEEDGVVAPVVVAEGDLD